MVNLGVSGEDAKLALELLHGMLLHLVSLCLMASLELVRGLEMMRALQLDLSAGNQGYLPFPPSQPHTDAVRGLGCCKGWRRT